jgi:hypothetical protein
MFQSFIAYQPELNFCFQEKNKLKRVCFIFFFITSLVSCEKGIDNDLGSVADLQLNLIQKVINTRDGGLLISGVSDKKATFVKTDANFNIIWKCDNYEWGLNQYGSWGQSSYTFEAINIFPDEDDHYICFGSVMQGGCVVFESVLIIELSPTGKELRRMEIKDFALHEVIKTSDGGYLLSGTKIIKLDRTLVTTWEKKLLENGSWTNKIIVTNDGSIASTCNHNDATYLEVLDNSGNELWSNLFKFSETPREEIGFGLVELHDGGFMVCGRSRNHYPPFDMDYGMTRLNKDGSMIWSRKFGSGADEWLEEFIYRSENEVIIRGNIGYPSQPVQKTFLLKVGMNGNIIDSATFDKVESLLFSNNNYLIKIYKEDDNYVHLSKVPLSELFSRLGN